ncbi:MAG: radical SAM protein [archaeon]
MVEVNPELFFYKFEGNYYVFSPSNQNILKVSKILFNQLKSKGIKDLSTEIRKFLLQQKVLLKNYVKKKEPLSLGLKITSDCNFNCSFCSQKGLSNNKTKMEWSIARIAVDSYMAQELPFYKIGFFGGEPLLNAPLISKIVSYISKIYPKKKVIYNINTNGFFLEKHLELIDKDNFLVGVSVHGSKEYYQKRNEISKYNQIISALQRYKNKEKVVITSLLCSDNVDTLSKMIDEFKLLGINNFALCIPSFNISKYWKDTGGGKVMAKKVIRLFRKCHKENVKLIFSNWGFWLEKTENCQSFAGASVFVNTNGVVNICHSIAKNIGNILKGDIKDLTVKTGNIPDKIKKELKYCCSCEIYNFCKGGCLADQTLNRSRDSTFCEFAKEFFKLYLRFLLKK